ncbi:MAG TPA: DinB family protein [Planctomycetaceae bacterium]|jgi:hypothetical protein|nr:DinB family protein [Planctomycetaceae bacterium]
MHPFDTYFKLFDFQRQRTLLTLDDVARQTDPAAILGWRPGPGRAHIAWQLMHIGVTEALFATERLLGTMPPYPELIPRFKGGSTPDDDIPTVEMIRQVLADGRSHLLTTLQSFGPDDLPKIPKWFEQRGWTLERVLEVVAWHEAHHQGQAHLTLNLWKAGQPA